jgi:hypothetical protein
MKSLQTFFINTNCSLILSDLFEYDFSSCVYTILKNTGYNVSNIDKDDKLKRNIQIGLLQKKNKKLSKYLNDNIKNLINFYLEINNIKDEELILRQKDGIITTKKLTKLNETMPLDFRGIISKLIFTVNRKQWMLIYGENNVVIKGIKNKPEDISFYNMFSNLDFTNKNKCIKQLESIRNAIYKSDNIKWFGKFVEDNQLLIPIKNIGLMKFRPSVFSMIDTDEIDKSIIWEDFIWPFCRSIIIHMEG